MAYIAPIHPPSSVRHALKLNLLSPDSECLVLGKSNRLEIHDPTPDGLIQRHARTIYGKITLLSKIRPPPSSAHNSNGTDHLFVGTDRHVYFTLSWDPALKQLRTERTFVDTADKTGRDSQTQDRCLTDPTGRCLVLELFEGILTVLPITQSKAAGKARSGDGAGATLGGKAPVGTLGEPVPVRITELFVRASAFVHSRAGAPEREKPRLALLYEDNEEEVRLKILKVDIPGSGQRGGSGGEIGELEGKDIAVEIDAGASHIIPVEAPAFGLLILSETRITYLDDISSQTLSEPLKEATIWATWTQIDASRWLLADDYGHLYFLMLTVDESHEINGWKLDLLGMTSRASTLIYLDGGFVFIGSHQGDSQVIQIREGGLEVVQTLANVAPILDFTIMDMGSRDSEGSTNEFSSGQARIVTGSGAFQDGSLRSVRSGVGLEELGSLGAMDHITELFALRSQPGLERFDTLVTSFIDETRVFQFAEDGQVEEIEDFAGFAMNEGTLLASNISHGRLLQVTRSSVCILDAESGMNECSWNPADQVSITAISANNKYLAISAGGTEAIILDIHSSLKEVTRKSFGSSRQISCIHLQDIYTDMCIIGFWQSADITIFNTSSLEEIKTAQISEEATTEDLPVPRSVLLTQLLPGQLPTLFIALANGQVVTFAIDESCNLSSRASIILGTRQPNFKALARSESGADGSTQQLYNVFATCEHPSLIYSSEGRIIYSAVTAEKATCVCPFDSAAFPGAIAIATNEDLKIALVGTERTTHVQTLPVGETVRRIAYSPKLKAFGMGTIKRNLKDGVETVQSSFKLADEIVFKELDSHSLNEDELVETVIRADFSDSESFVVGTAYLDDQAPSEARGRIMVFEVTQERTLKVVAETVVKGACRALAMMDGKIVAALVKTVILYSFTSSTFTKLATYRTSTAPIDISVSGNLIAVADLMKSVSIVKYKAGKLGEPDKLSEVARHFAIAWSTAVAPIDTDSFLEADAEGNLLVLYRNVNGVTSDDKRRMEVTSEICLGEMVNRIRTVHVPPAASSAEAVVVPKAFLATVEGSIYLFATIRPDKQDFLMRLQSAIASYLSQASSNPASNTSVYLLPGAPSLSFNQFRAFKNAVREAEEPFRFVDGELLEHFLDFDEGVQGKLLEGLPPAVGVGGAGAAGATGAAGRAMGVQEVVGMVERLRRMH